MQTIALTRPTGVEEVLLCQAIDPANENLRLRSLALLTYVDMYGEVPSSAQRIIDAIVVDAEADPLDKRLEQFAARRMISLATLLAAARNPTWCYIAFRVPRRRTRRSSRP